MMRHIFYMMHRNWAEEASASFVGINNQFSRSVRKKAGEAWGLWREEDRERRRQKCGKWRQWRVKLRKVSGKIIPKSAKQREKDAAEHKFIVNLQIRSPLCTAVATADGKPMPGTTEQEWRTPASQPATDGTGITTKRTEQNKNNTTMKRILTTLIAGILPLIMLFGCKENTEIQTEKTQWADSTEYACITMDIELPVANSKQSKAIRGYMTRKLGELMSQILCNTNFNDISGEASIEEIAAHYGQIVSKNFNENSKEMNDERNEGVEEDEVFILPFGGHFTMEKEYSSPKAVVFHLTSNIFEGGAHPNEIGFGHLTFSTATGKALTTIVDEQRLEELQPLFREGLTEYFHDPLTENGYELDTFLQIEGDLIPLPTCPPYLTADGVGFEYQQYEIACYASGMPTFVIPYEKIMPFMTAEAKALLAN